MFTIACCLVIGLRLGLDVWLICCYAHVFVLLSIVYVTLIFVLNTVTVAYCCPIEGQRVLNFST